MLELLAYNWEWKGISEVYVNVTSSVGDIHHFAWRAKHPRYTHYIDEDEARYAHWTAEECSSRCAAPHALRQVYNLYPVCIFICCISAIAICSQVAAQAPAELILLPPVLNIVPQSPCIAAAHSCCAKEDGVCANNARPPAKADVCILEVYASPCWFQSVLCTGCYLSTVSQCLCCCRHCVEVHSRAGMIADTSTIHEMLMDVVPAAFRGAAVSELKQPWPLAFTATGTTGLWWDK